MPAATVLIIDDTPDNIAVLFDSLRAADLRVLVSGNGPAGIEAAGITPPDLVLLDVMMPGLDGFETCRHLKALPGMAETPIIFMTALTDPVDKVRGLELGAVDYVTKPVFSAEVVARVRTHLQLRALQRDLAERNRELEERNEALDRAVQQQRWSDAALQRALDRAVIVVDAADRICFLARPAERLLRRFFPAAPLPALPSALRVLRGAAQVTAERDGHTLIAQRAEPPREDGMIMITLEPKPPPADPDQLRPLGLTPRETEILFWIAQGKTSPEIGTILGLAPATVKKHVESILPKLGVETRLAAALRAHELLSAPNPGG